MQLLPKGEVDHKSNLVQAVAWRRADTALSVVIQINVAYLRLSNSLS